MPHHKNGPNPDGVMFEKISRQESTKYHKHYGKKVRINRLDYSFVFCRNLRLNGELAEGVCSPNYQTLYLDVDSERMDETILHELMHAEACEAGLRQMNCWSMDLEELIVEMVGKAVSYNFKLVRRR
jgi:hypothetical protein